MNLKQQLRTTTFLLTLRYMVLFFVSVTILMGVINWAITDYMEQRTDDSLLTTTRTFTELFRLGGVEALAPLLSARQAAASPGEALYLVANQRYEPVLGASRG